MNHDKKFNYKEIEKLNNPERFLVQKPSEIAKVILSVASRPKTIVDIGAGSGVMISKIAQELPSSEKIFALDIEPAMIEWIKNNLEDQLVVPLLIENDQLPLGDSEADVVTMINLFHEVDDHLALLKEANRILKPGGCLLIVDWAKIDTPKGPPMEYRLATSVVEQFLNQANFDAVQTHNIFDWYFTITAVKRG